LVDFLKWWKENVCFNFLKAYLDLVKKFCVEEDQLYIAKRESGSDTVRLTRLSPDAPDYKEKFFLRDWYREAV
jgi:hypothetical protein